MITTCLECNFVLAGKQKIHYTFTDGSEMVEEYDLRNYDLLGNVIMKHCGNTFVDLLQCLQIFDCVLYYNNCFVACYTIL